MSVTTVLRGFKVPLPVLNAFLLANNINESEMLCAGIPPFYDEVDEVTTLLRNKRRLDSGGLADTPPPGFEELRTEVLSHAGDGAESLVDDPRYQNALYVVITDKRTYIPA